MHIDVLESLVVAVTIITLAYASYRDLASREVPEVVWVPAYAVALFNAALRWWTWHHAAGAVPWHRVVGAVLALLPAIVYGTLFAFKLLGGADLLAIALVALAHLDRPLIPLATFVLSSLAPLPLVLANLVNNTVINRRVMNGLKCARGSKRLLYLVGRPVTVAEFLEKKFAFLHTRPSPEGLVCSSEVDIDVDFGRQWLDLRRAVEEGLIRSTDYVVYSPAIPHVALITLSYVIALIAVPYLETLVSLP